MAPDQIVQLDRKLFIKCAKSIDHEYLCIYVDKEDKANKVGSKNTKRPDRAPQCNNRHFTSYACYIYSLRISYNIYYDKYMQKY